MHRFRFSLLLLLLSAALVNLAAVASSAAGADHQATDDPTNQHCIAHIEDQLKDGQLVLTEPVCFPTFDAAMRYAGIDSKAEIVPTTLTSRQLRAAYIIAVHHDYTNYRGGSLAVTSGTGICSGGYINFRTHYTSWNNKFESVVYGCDSGPIRHWDIAPSSGGNCSGSQFNAWQSAPDLGAMRNKTSCTVYG